ncbi:MAG TPA: hypothetical protein VIV11_15960 [Kofleriaceae bacterium]
MSRYPIASIALVGATLVGGLACDAKGGGTATSGGTGAKLAESGTKRGSAGGFSATLAQELGPPEGTLGAAAPGASMNSPAGTGAGGSAAAPTATAPTAAPTAAPAGAPAAGAPAAGAPAAGATTAPGAATAPPAGASAGAPAGAPMAPTIGAPTAPTAPAAGAPAGAAAAPAPSAAATPTAPGAKAPAPAVATAPPKPGAAPAPAPAAGAKPAPAATATAAPATTSAPAPAGPPAATSKRVYVKPSADLAAIKFDLEPNWERDVGEAGTFSLVVKVPNAEETRVFAVRYGYDDPAAPVDCDQYRKWLEDKKVMVPTVNRYRGGACYVEGSGAFRYLVNFGGKRIMCTGSMYKDAASASLGDLRDKVLMQAKKICETLAL